MAAGIKITGIKIEKHEGRRIVVNFIEKDTDEILFALNKNLEDDTYVDIINCRIENVDGMAKVTIPIVAGAGVERGE